MSESRRPARWAGATADTSGSARMRAARAVTWRRTGRGADDDFERRGASGREFGAQCRVDAIRARAAGEFAGVGGKELDRRERHSERNQPGRGEQCDPAWARDHEP